jgi:hypothetical protein
LRSFFCFHLLNLIIPPGGSGFGSLFPALRLKVFNKIDDTEGARDKNVPTIHNKYRHR